MVVGATHLFEEGPSFREAGGVCEDFDIVFSLWGVAVDVLHDELLGGLVS